MNSDKIKAEDIPKSRKHCPDLYIWTQKLNGYNTYYKHIITIRKKTQRTKRLYLKLRFYTEFRGKKNHFISKQIPPKFPHTSENFVGMTHFYGVMRQMRRGHNSIF